MLGLTERSLWRELVRLKSSSSPEDESAPIVSGNGGPEKLTEGVVRVGFSSQTAPFAQFPIALPELFWMVSSGEEKATTILVYCPAGTFAVLRKAFSISRCLTST